MCVVSAGEIVRHTLRAMGKRHEEENPLRNATPHQLARACWRIIEELERVGVRSPAERRLLAQDASHLLRALSYRFHRPGIPGSPELEVERSARPDVVAAFARLNRELANEGAKAARVETLVRAAEFVLGTDAHDWLYRALCAPGGPALPPGLQRAGRARESDVALVECLSELNAVRAAAAHRQIA